MRCFFGIPLTKQVRASMVELQEQLKKSSTRMKLVEPENLHVTVKFLGELGAREVEKAKKNLETVDKKGFQVKFTHVGAFPSQEYVKVLWVGVKEGKKQLEEVHDALGQEPNYVPHVTLARVKSKPDEVVKDLLTEKIDLGMKVEKVQLIESLLSEKGPTYQKVFEIELD
jgi:2'-5' RNA ligase